MSTEMIVLRRPENEKQSTSIAAIIGDVSSPIAIVAGVIAPIPISISVGVSWGPAAVVVAIVVIIAVTISIGATPATAARFC